MCLWGKITTDNRSDKLSVIFAWHKDAVGLAEGMPESTEINYIPEKTSWLVTGKLLAGAINIDDNGIVKASIDDTLVV